MNKRLPSLSKEHLPAVIESILFVADEAVEISMLARALRRPADAIEDEPDDAGPEASGAGAVPSPEPAEAPVQREEETAVKA